MLRRYFRYLLGAVGILTACSSFVFMIYNAFDQPMIVVGFLACVGGVALYLKALKRMV